MFDKDPLESADGSLDERCGGDFTFQTLLGEFIRNPDPATEADIPADADDEMDMVMCDNTLSDVFGEVLGWDGVRVLQKLQTRLRTLDTHVSEHDVISIIEAIGEGDFTDDQLIAFGSLQHEMSIYDT